MAVASLEMQLYAARLESANADQRTRNGELSDALRKLDPDVWESVTKLEVLGGTYRSNRIEKVASRAALWSLGAISDDDLRASVQDLIDYLPEWHRQQVDAQKKAARAVKTREANQDGQ